MRTVGSVGEVTQRRIYDAAIQLIAEHGFEAVSLRQIAREVGLQVGSLYNHITDKQDLLLNIMQRVMKDALESLHVEVDHHQPAVAQLHGFVRSHINFHTEKTAGSLIATNELRSLTTANYKRIVALRDQYDDALRKILKAGRDEGIFVVENIELTAAAMNALLTDVSRWFNPRGTLTREALISHHQTLCMNILRVPDSARVVDTPPAREAAKGASGRLRIAQ